jgi:hypothetical protein
MEKGMHKEAPTRFAPRKTQKEGIKHMATGTTHVFRSRGGIPYVPPLIHIEKNPPILREESTAMSSQEKRKEGAGGPKGDGVG